jgi:glycosyltransferase involved in cell wall biosynthesis
VLQRDVVRFPAYVSHYIALSRRSAAVMRTYLPADARLYPLANIIDAKRAAPVDPSANEELMVVGRLDEEKGVVLAALAGARTGLPIVFVGDGPLRSLLEANGARVTGWLPAAGVRSELAKARCLVFPSLWYETFGLVVSEAAARGIPAIVSDISAPADRVINGDTGWVFRSGDLEDLVRRMEITRDDAAVKAAGAATYQAYWASPADPVRHTSELLSIYADVLSSTAGVTDTAWADNARSPRENAPASSQRQSMNFVSPANAAARAMADADPNHPTAAQ